MAIVLTPGEPAGIGADITVLLAQTHREAPIVVMASEQLLAERAIDLKLPLTIIPYTDHTSITQSPGSLTVIDVPLSAPVVPGRLNLANSAYVLSTLEQAVKGCLNQQFDAMVTGPVHKATIHQYMVNNHANSHGFHGHTEWLKEQTRSEHVVMLLASEQLKVALLTTHVPLAKVPTLVTAQRLERTIEVLHKGLVEHFNMRSPCIYICGLNPHAGEDGLLGDEETKVIIPTVNQMLRKGYRLVGPLPADTLFTPKHLQQADAVLAMYHDQGLPVLKYQGFGKACNISLGLPIIRTSVDHGTALDLAAQGGVHIGSVQQAIKSAQEMVRSARRYGV